MVMNGEHLSNLNDLKRCFSLDELLYSFYNGELAYFLHQISEHEKAEQLQQITEHNALLLIRLYALLDLPFEDTEEKIRHDHASAL